MKGIEKLNIENYKPDFASMKAFALDEMRAEENIVNKLAVKESLGKGFEVANVRSLSSNWYKFRKELKKELSFLEISTITDQFIKYMRENKNKNASINNEQFIAEVFEFVSRKLVEENYINNRFVSEQTRKQAMQLILLPKIRSYIHEAFSRGVKKINNESHAKIFEEFKDQVEDYFINMFKSGQLKEIETNE